MPYADFATSEIGTVEQQYQHLHAIYTLLDLILDLLSGMQFLYNVMALAITYPRIWRR